MCLELVSPGALRAMLRAGSGSGLAWLCCLRAAGSDAVLARYRAELGSAVTRGVEGRRGARCGRLSQIFPLARESEHQHSLRSRPRFRRPMLRSRPMNSRRDSVNRTACAARRRSASWRVGICSLRWATVGQSDLVSFVPTRRTVRSASSFAHAMCSVAVLHCPVGSGDTRLSGSVPPPRPGQHARGQAGARSEGHLESREVPLLSTATPVAEKPVSNFLPGEKPTWELYSKCVHCGLCLDQCPTYRALGTEMDSPRGRIYQMVQVDEGRLALGESFVTHIDRCLGCLNCQTACPSGVPYGSLLERARSQIVEHYRRPWLERAIRTHFLRADSAVVPPSGETCQVCAFLSALRLAEPRTAQRPPEGHWASPNWTLFRRASKATSRSAILERSIRPKALAAGAWHC